MNETKEYCEQEFKTLYPEIKRLSNPHEYYVDLTRELLNLKNELIEKGYIVDGANGKEITKEGYNYLLQKRALTFSQSTEFSPKTSFTQDMKSFLRNTAK